MGGHASDGHPLFGGWPAVYCYYLEKGMKKEDIDNMPLYLAFLGMGALSEDKINLRLSEKDGDAYRIALAKKKMGIHG